MSKRTQFAAAITAALSYNPLNETVRRMKNTSLNNLDMVKFFSNPDIREQVIPHFNEAIMYLSNPHLFAPQNVEKYYTGTGYRNQGNIASFDRHFWSTYVRDCIHSFLSKTWTPVECEGGLFIKTVDVNDIFKVSRATIHYGFENLKAWKERIKQDSTYRYEVLYSGLFDVKMSFNDIHNKAYLYSYGPKAKSNCISFMLRMAWNHIQAKTI